MEPKFQSSFIPKGPLATSGSLASSQPKERSLVGFLSSIVFGIAVALSVLVFAYNLYLGYSIKKMGAELDTARSEIDQASVSELTRLNDRIISTQDLLNTHTVVSPLFAFLETSTLQTVRFTEFDLEDGNNGLVLTMKGQARGYSAVALQADIFSKSKYMKNPMFSDLDLDDKGNVTFSFKAMVDPTLVSFKREVEAEGASAPVLTAPVANPSATSTATSTKTTSTPVTQTSTTTKATSTPR